MLKEISSRRCLIFTFCFVLRLFLFTQVSHQDRIFIYVPYTLSQEDAKSYCRDHYTDLATFQSASEIAALQTAWKVVFCWIGYQRVTHGSSSWIWSDGEINNFTQWFPGEPNNGGGREDCTGMANSVWYDTSCDNLMPFVCYEDEPILVQSNKTWEEALEDCRALQIVPYSRPNYFKHVYDLLQIRSANFTSINKGMITDAQTQEVWIGLRYLAGEWLWLNDNPLQIQLPGCPADGNYCGAFTNRGEIQLRNCSEKKNFFCSRN